MLLQYWLSFCQFSTYLWPQRKSATDEPPATAAAEAAVVVDRPIEETTGVGEAVVDQQLHARHVAELRGGMIGMKGWPTLPGAICRPGGGVSHPLLVPLLPYATVIRAH